MQKRILKTLVVLLILLTSIAYSGLSTSLSITGEAKFRIKADIRVTDIRFKNASNATTRYESEFTKDTITSGFNLSNTSGTISYEVDITNKGEIDAAAYDLLTTSTNNNGVNITISYVDDNNVTHTNEPISTALPIIVPFQTTKTITVTYTSTVAGNVDIINTFDFRTVYYIKYVDASAPTVDIIPKTVKYENVNTTISSTTPTKTGYSFLGWTDLQAAQVAKSSFAPGATYTANQNKILYAVWSGTLCKRASQLHHETCEQTSTSAYCSADGYYKGGEKNTTEIYYGTLGQKVNNENVLTSGDAFVCDVNGDGTYNETNEMFYYITNLESNNNYAVLLYSQDTSSGAVAYYSSAYENWHGPQTAVSSLPTTSTWDNISLSSTSRQLYATSDLSTYVTTTNNGSNTLGTFDYSGKAGRLLTVKELRSACPSAQAYNGGAGVGSLSSCSYLMENTKYSSSSKSSNGYWLETPYASDSGYVWDMYGYDRRLNINGANYSNYFGARPAIEVPKTSIDLDIKSYFITFNTQSDFTENQFKTISAGNAIGELPTPKRRGYKFEGWYTDTNYTTQVTITTKPSASTTYYAKWSVKTICKRASSLHTATCEYTSVNGFCYGDGYYVGGSKNTRTITYGNFGANASTINAGDAFVCDINGDGSFNETNEKFYYVSDYYDTEKQTFDTNEAVLIYYKDTSNGTVAYDSSNENWHGPVTALNSLPDETTWKNVYLKESKRQLYAWDGSSSTYVTTTNNGGNTLGKFDYGTKAGRLLTIKELRTGCPNASRSSGSLSSCSYLMENTRYENSSNTNYGYWLETPHASYSNGVWGVDGSGRGLNNISANNSGYCGARPAIEVPKASIDKTVRSYLITFNTNGADGDNKENSTRTISVGDPVGNLPTAPSKSGKVFDGWYTAATGGTKISATTVPTGSTTYYAHFEDVWAEDLEYDNSNVDMEAENVQQALDCIKSLLDNGTLPSSCVKQYKQYICKRATSLHQETCESTSTSYYCSASGDVGNGNTITYGVLGTGSSLTAGEALDCKVSTTGGYTERFYYVTDLESNSKYAVLIYDSNTTGGVRSNSNVAYYSVASENWRGPVTAAAQLPTTSQWDNVSLYETTRQLYATTGGSSPTYVTTTNNGSNTLGTFDYSGYAARLLTYKELKAGCSNATNLGSTGALTNCNYIMENTKYGDSSRATYGPWLETPRASYSRLVWGVFGFGRSLSSSSAYDSGFFGARPAIEVLKSKIQLD